MWRETAVACITDGCGWWQRGGDARAVQRAGEVHEILKPGHVVKSADPATLPTRAGR